MQATCMLWRQATPSQIKQRLLDLLRVYFEQPRYVHNIEHMRSGSHFVERI